MSEKDEAVAMSSRFTRDAVRPGPDSRRGVPVPVATLLLGVTVLLAFLAAPGVVAQGLDLDQANGATADGLDFGDVVGDLGFGDLPLGLKLTLGVAAVGAAAALAFMGGTKFVNAQNVLENDSRRMIYEYIQEHPGVHLRAAATALELSTTNVLWHLRKLESARLVSSKKFEGYKVFYPVEGGVASRDRAIGASVLRNPNAKQILEFVLGQPSAHQREVARALGVNHGTVRWHLRKLEDAELIVTVKSDGNAAYYVTELGVKLLADDGSSVAAAHREGAASAPGAAHGHAAAASPHATPATGRGASQAFVPDDDED